MTRSILSSVAALGAALTALAPHSALAQRLDYDGGSSAEAGEGDSAPADGDDAPRRKHTPKATIAPYLEFQQIAQVELAPGNEAVTYSVAAAGVDAAIAGRNNTGSLSLRYERRFGYGSTRIADADAVSGIARYSGTIVPRALTFDAGALATRTSVQNNGAGVLSPLAVRDNVTQVYSAYIGPNIATRVGAVAVTGSYRLGYTKVESPNAPVGPGVDLFGDSVSHMAAVRAATRAGEVLPVGLALEAGALREDVSNLDQRVSDLHVRGDVTLPVGRDLALVGGVGYEKVQISSRDAVRDGAGNPVIGSDGRYVTDKSQPRVLAYDVAGLIWDAGVLWRPSKRTALEAHFGRRYGSTSYFGSFAYAPNSRSSLNVSVYDTVSGFGSTLNNSLAGLSSDFTALRNPLTGDIGGCVAAATGNGCYSGAIGSLRSAVFRDRGVMASYALNLGRVQAGVGAGYDQHKFIAAPGTVLAAANGTIDENTWIAAYLNGRIDRNSSFATNVRANWFQSGDALAGDVNAIGASAAYLRSFGPRLSGTAAVGVDGINRDILADQWVASALLGLRYSF